MGNQSFGFVRRQRLLHCFFERWDFGIEGTAQGCFPVSFCGRHDFCPQLEMDFLEACAFGKGYQVALIEVQHRIRVRRL